MFIFPSCLSFLSFVSISKNADRVFAHPWKQAMINEMCALQGNEVGNLVSLSLEKFVLVVNGCYNKIIFIQ